VENCAAAGARWPAAKFHARLCAGFADDSVSLDGSLRPHRPRASTGPADFRIRPKYAASSRSRSILNGLASGNCFEEAVCHAYASSSSETHDPRRSALPMDPRALRKRLWAPKPEPKQDDRAVSAIDLADAGSIPELLAGFGQAGLRPSYAIPRPISASAAAAAVADDSCGLPAVHCGIAPSMRDRVSAPW